MIVKLRNGELQEMDIDPDNIDPEMAKDIEEVYIIKTVLRPTFSLKPVQAVKEEPQDAPAPAAKKQEPPKKRRTQAEMKALREKQAKEKEAKEAKVNK
jgi:hypothetical protein